MQKLAIGLKTYADNSRHRFLERLDISFTYRLDLTNVRAGDNPLGALGDLSQNCLGPVISQIGTSWTADPSFAIAYKFLSSSLLNTGAAPQLVQENADKA